jgi:organic hydroperoxide reductase OsmC/OhrA
MALEMRPTCECCGRDLPPDSTEALICSFECTFCAACAADRLDGHRCPNCAGELVRRPIRSSVRLLPNPPFEIRAQTQLRTNSENLTRITHEYRVTVAWTGNKGSGTSSYRSYSRDHEIASHEKPAIPGSSDPGFLGDPARWNPEDLFVASISACHKLWYLHLCADAGIVVDAYSDMACGVMVEVQGHGGHFTLVHLSPVVTIRAGDTGMARSLHERAHERCFIANSVTCRVTCEPVIVLA